MEPPPPPPDTLRARARARQLLDDLRRASPDALRPGGLDIAPAVEQVLYHGLLEPRPAAPGTFSSLGAGARRLARRAAALRPTVGARKVGRADVLVLLLTPVHGQLFDPVGAELRRQADSPRVARVTAGRASSDPVLGALPAISGQPTRGSLRAMLRAGMKADRLRDAASGWRETLGPEASEWLRGIVADAIVRLTIAAVELDATLARARPRVAIAYDEIDAWGRILCAVAARHGVAVVDLPHAEAVAVEAIRGVGYDAMGVYGPRAARVLEAAGVPRERVAVVGPARFDALVRADPAPPEAPPRVVMAAQYRGRAMTDEMRATILSTAAAAADAVGGAVELVPHPIERASSWEAAVAARPARPPVSIVRGATLHERLPGAALMVTGWSNSVYEAVLSGVPALTVHAGPGEPPMPFAREGISTEVRGPDEASEVAPRLAREPGRSSALTRGRAALSDHLGPLDGRAAARSAALVARFLDP